MTYYQTASLKRANFQTLKRNQNTIKSASFAQSKLGPISNALILGVLVAFVGLIYLTQVTKTSSLSMEANKLETRKQQLVESNQQLELEAARLKSIKRVSESSVAKALTNKPTSVDYVNN